MSMWINQLLHRALEEKIPQLDRVLDDLLYKTIIQDWEYYALYVYHITFEDYNNKMEELLLNDPEEIKEFFKAWVGTWIKNYRKRVRLVWNEELYNRQYNQATELIRKGRERLSYQQIVDMMYPVIECLIHHGEIVFVKTLAEQLILQELGKEQKRITTLNDKINILNRIFNRIRHLCYTDDPLINIKAKDYLKRGNVNWI